MVLLCWSSRQKIRPPVALELSETQREDPSPHGLETQQSERGSDWPSVDQVASPEPITDMLCQTVAMRVGGHSKHPSGSQNNHLYGWCEGPEAQ